MARTNRRKNYPKNWQFVHYQRDGIRDDVHHNTDGYLGEGIRSNKAKRRFKRLRSKKNRRIDLED